MENMNKNPPLTNFTFLERDYKSIITDIKDIDSTGQSSSMSFNRKTIVLNNGTKVYVTERIVKGEMLYYQYDWYSESGEEILKFHSEKHDDEDYQVNTGNHHIHHSSVIKLHNMDRFPNFHHQTLHSVMEMIRLHMLADQALTTIKQNRKSKT